MNLRFLKWMLGFAAILPAGLLQAEPAPRRPQVEAAEISAMPAWDNVFGNAVWQKAGVASVPLVAPSNVTLHSPPEGTQVKVLWCQDFLLVRFDCQDRSIVQLPGETGPNPQRDLFYYKADSVEVFLDPVGDGRMYMEFELSPNNGVFDAIYFCTTTPRSQPDFSLQADVVNRDLFSIKEWNLDGLRTAARIWPPAEGSGWSVIAAFPAAEILKRLGTTHFSAGMKLKVNLVRFDYFSDGRPYEITNWAPVLGGCAHISPAGMGTIVLAPNP